MKQQSVQLISFLSEQHFELHFILPSNMHFEIQAIFKPKKQWSKLKVKGQLPPFYSMNKKSKAQEQSCLCYDGQWDNSV